MNFKLNDFNYYKHFLSLRGDYLDYHKVTANEMCQLKTRQQKIYLPQSVCSQSVN